MDCAPQIPEPSAYLGVDCSLTGRRWIGPGIETQRAADMLVQRCGLLGPVAQVLARMGVSPEGAEAFLAPTLRDLLPDPRTLKDAKTAAERVNAAVAADEKIAIFADYDVDGGSSAALLVDWLRQQSRSATLYVPDRIDEGYGPNPEAIARLARDHELIVCVDCGTLSHDALAAGRAADILVLDHHLGGETLPPALAVVNPNRQDETGTLAHLCAAAVVFLVLVEAGRQLRQSGKPGPDLMSMLDLVALATVADVAPLTGVNRAFVRQGLTVMARRERPGLAALADIARLDAAPSAYHLGYVLGPRINAGGRIGQADLGARLLATAETQEAAALSERLDRLNAERRDVEAAVRAAAMHQAEQRDLEAPLVWAAGESWHPGVVGIVASRLKEQVNRPTLVIGIEKGLGRGSGRSVPGIDLGAAVQRVAAEGLLLKGGGHKMAAGLTVEVDQIEPAMTRLSELLARQGADRLGARDLRLDGVLMPNAVAPGLIEALDAAGPFGASASAPRFAFADVQIFSTRIVGEDHLKIRFGDTTGARIEAIAFSAMQSTLGHELHNHAGRRFHLAGRVELNRWQGRDAVQLNLQGAALA